MQSVLTGKALSTHKEKTVLRLKSLLNAYQLNKHHSVRFRESLKGCNETNREYSHTLTKLRNLYLAANGLTIFEGLCELVILEQLIRKSPDIRLLLCEREVATIMRATTLAKNYWTLRERVDDCLTMLRLEK